jgi:hypothetical protein
MKTLWCKNQENPSDRISHAWAPLNDNNLNITICSTTRKPTHLFRTKCVSLDSV